MRPRRLLLLLAVLLPLLLLAVSNTGGSNASTFPLEAPNTGPWLSNTALGGNPDSTTFVNIPEPGANFSALISGADGDLTTAAGNEPAGGVRRGAVMLTVDAPATLGLANGPCSTVISTFFTMMNASVDNSAANLLVPAGPAGDLLRNLAQDDDVDGIPNHVEQYPSYLNVLTDPDLPGQGLPPIQPFARYSGFDSVANTTVILQVLYFAPGALRALPNSGAHTAAQGNQLLVVLQDPTLPPANGSISDFCTALTSESNFFGVAHDNLCTPPIGAPGVCDPLILGGATQRKGVDNDPDGPGPLNGCNGGGVPTSNDESDPVGSPGSASCPARMTNPSVSKTVQILLQGASQRDYDGDGIEQALDACNRTWSDPDGVPDLATGDHFNPRSVDIVMDPDADGLDNSCDDTDGTPNVDPDGDAWQNRLDNCPTGPANGGASNLNNTQSLRERHVDSTPGGTYNSGEEIWLDNDNTLTVSAGDTNLYDPTAPAATIGTPLVRFLGPEAGGGAALERHVDSANAGLGAGRYKTAASDGGGATALHEAIVLDANNNRRFDTGETVLGDDPSSPDPVDGNLLVGFLPEAKHIGVVSISGIQTTDNVTIGPVATTGTKTDYNRNNIVLETGLGSRVVSWENDVPTAYTPAASIGAGGITAGATAVPYASTGDPILVDDEIRVDSEQMRVTAINTGTNTLTVARGRSLTTAAAHAAAAPISRVQPSLAQEPAATAANGPVVIKFAQNVNRGNADFDVVYPGQVLDGGSRNDVIGPVTLADPGCETGTDGPNVPDGHYHRAGTIARMCVGATDADGDGVCLTSTHATDLHDPNDANTNSDGDAVGDRNDNCISVANSPAAGFTQPDKDQDGVGDACDTFNDSDGDGFSDRMEGASSVANDFVGVGSPGLGAEEGSFCENAVDNDGDGTVNDGCPRAGPAEGACADAADSDTDTYTNDGCPAVNAGLTTVPAGTYQNVSCARGVGGAAFHNGLALASNANPADMNGDGVTDIFESGELAGSFGQPTSLAGERKDIAPDVPSALGGGTGDGTVDITDRGVIAGRFGQTAC